jgi:hypothetical protein
MRKALIGSGQDRAFAGITEPPALSPPALLCLRMICSENRFTFFRIML